MSCEDRFGCDKQRGICIPAITYGDQIKNGSTHPQGSDVWTQRELDGIRARAFAALPDCELPDVLNDALSEMPREILP